jgi:hypothetical protein
MKIGILLLNKKNVYLTKSLDLPKRPRWDKDFLTNLISGQKVVCSENTLKLLPKSLLKVAYFTTNINCNYDINFGIDTFKDIVDLLFIVRSQGEEDGKVFRLDNYTKILDKGGLEIWKNSKSLMMEN